MSPNVPIPLTWEYARNACPKRVFSSHRFALRPLPSHPLARWRRDGLSHWMPSAFRSRVRRGCTRTAQSTGTTAVDPTSFDPQARQSTSTPRKSSVGGVGLLGPTGRRPPIAWRAFSATAIWRFDTAMLRGSDRTLRRRTDGRSRRRSLTWGDAQTGPPIGDLARS